MHYRRLGEVWLSGMKVIMKPIDVIATFPLDGIPNPVRIRIEENDEQVVINIHRILAKTPKKFGQLRHIIYKCEGVINGSMRPFELKFEQNFCRWYMYRM